MPVRPITRERLVASAKRRVRKARRRAGDALRERGVELGGRGAKSSGDGAGKRVPGIVEEFTDRWISGWVAVSPDAAPVRVSLRAGDQEVAAAWAGDVRDDRTNWGEVRGFQLRIRDVWSYVGKRDKLTIRVDGRSLPIAGHGMFLNPPRNGRYSLGDLEQKMASGHVFGQGGRLQLSKKLDTQWQATVMGLYAEVRKILTEAKGYDAFFVYGTLLGAVREGGVIGHDIDFDCAYVSAHTDGAKAAAELRDIALVLVDKGFDVECRRTALHIHDAKDPDARIDLFHLYFAADGRLAAPFGVAGTNVITRDEWTGTHEIDFCGSRGLVPDVAEKFAEHLYGASWRLPKPGFDWNRDRTDRAREGIVPISLCRVVHWENAYAHTPAQTAPSSWCVELLTRPDLPGTVVDIGCGDGRDTVAFAASGRTAVGLDRSARAVALASGRDDTSGARFAVCDVADATAVHRQLTDIVSAADGPVLLHLRFVVHAIGEATERTLLAALAATTRPGDVLAAEFRTERDEQLPKALPGKNYRRFVPGAAFDARLDAAGFEVVETADGTGLAPFGDEDPELHRVVARRR